MTSTGYGGQVRPSENKTEYVYILMCNNKKTYVGHTSNLNPPTPAAAGFGGRDGSVLIPLGLPWK